MAQYLMLIAAVLFGAGMRHIDAKTGHDFGFWTMIAVIVLTFPPLWRWLS